MQDAIQPNIGIVTPPVKSKKPRIIISIVILVILAAGATYYVWKNIYNPFDAPTDCCGQYLSPDITDPSIPVTVSELDYDNYLANVLPVEKFTDAPYATSGPALITYTDSGKLVVKLPLIPNMVDSKQNVIVRISSILDSEGKEVFDKKSAFEDDSFFTSLDNLRVVDAPVRHIEGSRSPRLVSGASDSDIVQIKGKITLVLPADAKILSIGAADLNKPIKTLDGILTLKSLSNSETPSGETGTTIVFNYNGFTDRLESMNAYDIEGKDLAISSKEGFSNNSSYDNKDYTVTVQGKAEKLVFFEVPSHIIREIPFELNLAEAKKAEAAATAVSEDVKKQVIDAQIKRYTVMSSKNPQKIREYVKNLFDNSTEEGRSELDDLNGLSDAEVLTTAGFMLTFFPADATKPGVIEKMLRADNAVWKTISENKVEIKISSDDGFFTTLNSIKNNGVWY